MGVRIGGRRKFTVGFLETPSTSSKLLYNFGFKHAIDSLVYLRCWKTFNSEYQAQNWREFQSSLTSIISDVHPRVLQHRNSLLFEQNGIEQIIDNWTRFETTSCTILTGLSELVGDFCTCPCQLLFSSRSGFSKWKIKWTFGTWRAHQVEFVHLELRMFPRAMSGLQKCGQESVAWLRNAECGVHEALKWKSRIGISSCVFRPAEVQEKHNNYHSQA